jgi:hypothetical protein
MIERKTGSRNGVDSSNWRMAVFVSVILHLIFIWVQVEGLGVSRYHYFT